MHEQGMHGCMPRSFFSHGRRTPASRMQVVVLADASLTEAKRIDTFCHANGIAFIWAQTRGVFASVFTDFGPNFTVIDVDGESRAGGSIACTIPGAPLAGHGGHVA